MTDNANRCILPTVPWRALVAQLDRVLPSGGKGCGFKSRRARHFFPKEITPWCNGSTRDFGSLDPGSNPGGVATISNGATDSAKAEAMSVLFFRIITTGTAGGFRLKKRSCPVSVPCTITRQLFVWRIHGKYGGILRADRVTFIRKTPRFRRDFVQIS